MSGFSKHVVSVSARIGAEPDKLYGIIADFRYLHPRILPKQFSDLTVEKGGTGAGTIFQYKMRAYGLTRNVRAVVSEPDPGRVLVETTLEGNRVVTAFTVEPSIETGQAEVTISTELRVRSGVLGAIERLMTTRLLRPIYQQELALLAVCAGSI